MYSNMNLYHSWICVCCLFLDYQLFLNERSSVGDWVAVVDRVETLFKRVMSVYGMGTVSHSYLYFIMIYYYLRQGGYVFAWVCLWVYEFICAFVNKITEKLTDGF